MTQPMTAPGLTTTRRSSRLPRRLPADRFAGRWPATDQLTRGTPPAAARTPVTGPAARPPSITAAALQGRVAQDTQQRQINTAAAETNREQDAAAAMREEDGAHVQTPGRAQITAHPQPEFVERIAAITEQFSNPSTGETSVGRPLATVDEHEADYEYESAPSQRQTITGPRR